MKRAFLLLITCCFLVTCSNLMQDNPDELSLTLFRRSVLDQKVRMLTLRFGEDRYAAYDLQNARLEKIWKGGVHWNGAAFNNIKTVQPTSYGENYWQHTEDKSEWLIELNGDRQYAKVAFKSYHVEPQGIELHYLLSDQRGNKIEISERPRFNNTIELPIFRRDFKVISNPNNKIKIYLGEHYLPSYVGAPMIVSYALPFVGDTIPPIQSLNANGAQFWLDRSGCNTCHAMAENKIGPGYQLIAERYGNDKETINQLTSRIKKGSSGHWGTVAMIPHPQLSDKDIDRMVKYILSLKPKGAAKKSNNVFTKEEKSKKPGFGSALTEVHPAYDLQTIRPTWFKPRVGAMDFLPDGRLLLSTWDSIGSVYALSGVQTGDTNQMDIQQIASGLAEPLGMTTVGDDIFVLQKQELTQLIDHNKGQLIDEYRSINHSFGVSADFHEYAYGLVFQDGYFYGGLGLAMRLMSHELQLPDRGKAFKIGLDGTFETIATGLRQPNGIGVGVDDQIFITENQGQWVPACKFIHLQEGKFYGCQYGKGNEYASYEMTPPAVWLPQDEIGNSPGQPLPINDGPYKGQMIHCEVTHGGIKRVFLEKVNGEYQGCVFRFSQGLEAGINRMVWGPDAALYIGGVGMNGNWGHKGKQFGLQRLRYNGKVPFELLAVRAQPDGFELEFTDAVAASDADFRQMLNIQQWYYKSTPAYGGPKLGLTDLKITSVNPSPDRKKWQIIIRGLKEGYVIYFLFDESLKNAKGESLWSGETWYTLNAIPELI